MAVEFTEDFVKENGFSEEQVQALTGYVAPKIDELKEELNGKALENAEGILDSVISTTQQKFEVELPREQGEKHADYLTRLNEHVLSGSKSEVERLKSDYETKLKEFKGGDALKSELDEIKGKYNTALEKYANYDEMKEKADQFESLSQSNAALTRQVSYNSVKPNFPDTIDPRIVRVEWSEFIERVEDKWIVGFDTEKNKAIATEKDNPKNIVELSSLVEKDDELNKLTEERQQSGSGTKPASKEVVEGVPFKVDIKAPMTEIHKEIRTHLEGKGLAVSSNQYGDEYAKILETITKKRTSK